MRKFGREGGKGRACMTILALNGVCTAFCTLTKDKSELELHIYDTNCSTWIHEWKRIVSGPNQIY